MATAYAETVKKMQSDSAKIRAEKHQIEADIFASIREAHNSLTRPGAYIETERKNINLLVLPESTSSVTYTISQIPYAAIDDLEIAASLPANNANKFIIFKSKRPIVRKLLNGGLSFVETEADAGAKALALYLRLTAEIVTFKTSK